MDRIAEAEAEVGALEEKLSDPAIYAGGGDDAAGLVGELEAAKAALDALMARWEALESKKDE